MKYLLSLCLAAAFVAPAAAQDEAFTGKIFTAKGTVEYLKSGTTTWALVKVPQLIEAGDKIKTGAKAKAELYLKHGSKIRIGADSTFTLNKVSAEENSVEMLVGRMQAWIRKAANRKFTVRTPSAVCAVRGTVFEVEVDPAGQTVWNLFSGVIQVSDAQNRTVTLAPNQRVAVTPEKGVDQPAPLPAEVKQPEEPKTIKEEKADIKADQAEQKKAAEQAAAAVKEEPAAAPVEAVKEEPVVEETIPEVVTPPTSVIETKTVEEEKVVEEPPVVSESAPS